MKKRFFLIFFIFCQAAFAQANETIPPSPYIQVLKFLLATMCSSFMILSAISFLRFRLRKKEREYKDLLKLFKIKEDQFRLSTVENEYSVADYILPVGFATTICLFFWAVIFMGSAWEDQMHQTGSVVIVGIGEDFIRPATLAMTYAFIGGFLWSAQNITRRLLSADLSPGIYYATGLRILFASLVSLILATMMHSTPLIDYSTGLLPATSFLTGMLPEQALRYIKERVRVFSRAAKEDQHILELERVEGINLFHKTRLGEIGIDNAQNLAEASMIEVLLKTPFAPRQILDWIVQAKLYLLADEEFFKLRKVGVRTVFNFYRAEDPEKLLAWIAEETGISKLLLFNIQQRVREDPDVAALWHIQNRLTISIFGESESPN